MERLFLTIFSYFIRIFLSIFLGELLLSCLHIKSEVLKYGIKVLRGCQMVVKYSIALKSVDINRDLYQTGLRI